MLVAAKTTKTPGKEIFCPLVKVDVKKREVWGVVTAELPDKDNEICDYSTTVPYYKAVVDEMSKVEEVNPDGGTNIFPLRAMHGLIAAGKGIAIEFRDDSKEVYMGFKVVDDAEWKKVQENVYTGFSQGGRYIKKWQDGDYVRYTAKPGEVSLVDMPCLTRAHFEVVKADGTVEMRKFGKVKPSGEIPTTPGQLPIRPTPVEDDHEDATSVGNSRTPELTADCKCSCAECKGGNHEACAATEKCPQSSKAAKVKKRPSAKESEKITNLIKGMVEDSINRHAYGRLGKGMYQVQNFASIIEQLKWLWVDLEYERAAEGDASPATDDLKASFDNILDAFLDYVEEEIQELSAHAAAFEPGGMAMTTKNADLLKAARSKSFAAHFKKAAAHHDALADYHKRIADAHDAHSEHHTAMMGKAGENPMAAHHKAAAAFHKTLHGHHMNLHKKHSTHAEHLTKMAAACAEEDAEKIAKMLEFELELPPTPTPEEVAKAAADKEAADKAAADKAAADKATLEKAAADKVAADKAAADKAAAAAAATTPPAPDLAAQIAKAVNDALAPVIEEMKKAAAPKEPAIKTFPVPRPGVTIPDASIPEIAKPITGPDIKGVDPMLAHLVKVEV